MLMKGGSKVVGARHWVRLKAWQLYLFYWSPVLVNLMFSFAVRLWLGFLRQLYLRAVVYS